MDSPRLTESEVQTLLLCGRVLSKIAYLTETATPETITQEQINGISAVAEAFHNLPSVIATNRPIYETSNIQSLVTLLKKHDF